jgi:hypothetical protein
MLFCTAFLLCLLALCGDVAQDYALTEPSWQQPIGRSPQPWTVKGSVMVSPDVCSVISTS